MKENVHSYEEITLARIRGGSRKPFPKDSPEAEDNIATMVISYLRQEWDHLLKRRLVPKPTNTRQLVFTPTSGMILWENLNKNVPEKAMDLAIKAENPEGFIFRDNANNAVSRLTEFYLRQAHLKYIVNFKDQRALFQHLTRVTRAIFDSVWMEVGGCEKAVIDSPIINLYRTSRLLSSKFTYELRYRFNIASATKCELMPVGLVEPKSNVISTPKSN